jgi:hypothetical protein
LICTADFRLSSSASYFPPAFPVFIVTIYFIYNLEAPFFLAEEVEEDGRRRGTAGNNGGGQRPPPLVHGGPRGCCRGGSAARARRGKTRTGRGGDSGVAARHAQGLRATPHPGPPRPRAPPRRPPAATPGLVRPFPPLDFVVVVVGVVFVSFNHLKVGC